MPVSAETLQALMEAGITGDALLNVVRKIDADTAAAARIKVRSSGAERQARHRTNLRGEVTESDVTVTRDSDVTSVTPPPPRDKSTPPETSLRSESQRTRRAAFEELWSAFPKRIGSNPKQPAEEKFCRLLKANDDPDGLASEIIAGARRYAASVSGADPKFTAQALTWLNQGRWKDEHAVAPFARDGPVPRPAPVNNRRAALTEILDFAHGLEDR